MSETMRIVYGKSSNAGSTALQRALGKVAVSDLAAAGAAHRSHFAGRERREIVVEHERLGRLARLVDAVEALDIVGGAKRDRDKCLRLTRVNSAEPCARGRTCVSMVIAADILGAAARLPACLSPGPASEGRGTRRSPTRL